MPKPTADELAKAFGQFLSCFSIPGSLDVHAINLRRPAADVEIFFLEGIQICSRYAHPEEWEPNA